MQNIFCFFENRGLFVGRMGENIQACPSTDDFNGRVSVE